MGTELRLTELSAGYARTDVLRKLNATFHAGALSAVLGPNGAGKTTLLRVIAGGVPAREGKIVCGGSDLLAIRARERARIVALVPQVTGDFAPLTVREAVLLARYPHMQQRFALSASDQQAANEAMQTLGLQQHAQKLCAQLSGGELRRVLIAQGLAQQAQVLLLDEPTAFLDPPAQHDVLRCVSELARTRGLTVICVLHDPRLAALYAKHVLLLRDGSAVAEGPVHEVLTADNLAAAYGCAPNSIAVAEVTR